MGSVHCQGNYIIVGAHTSVTCLHNLIQDYSYHLCSNELLLYQGWSHVCSHPNVLSILGRIYTYIFKPRHFVEPWTKSIREHCPTLLIFWLKTILSFVCPCTCGSVIWLIAQLKQGTIFINHIAISRATTMVSWATTSLLKFTIKSALSWGGSILLWVDGMGPWRSSST